MSAKQSKRETNEPTITTTVRLPESIHTELKVIAAKERKSLNLLLEEVIEKFIKQYKAK